MRILNWLARRLGYVKSAPGDWMPAKKVETTAASHTAHAQDYDPDVEFERLSITPVLNPVLESFKKVENGEARILEAYLFEGKWDANGKLCRAKEAGPTYRLRKVAGEDLLAHLKEAAQTLKQHPATVKRISEARENAISKLRENGFDDGNLFDAPLSQYDPAQYTEYTPLYGGPHFKQLYLYDYLLMHSRAFEAWNHNPLAKRIINILAQYSFGRGFKVKSKIEAQQAAWDAWAKTHNILEKISKFWVREYLLYGELMIDKALWQSVDPSTVWDIITDPDNVEDVYYYHQQYPTAYTQFTGKQVPGVPGSADVRPLEFIIRQLPFDRIIHIKNECVSNEKRGRSKLFPILGWLKRIKDLYNAEVIGAWLRASFIWDDTIKGSQSDIDSHVQKYNGMPNPGTVFAHNEAVERKPMMPGAPAPGTDNTGNDILAFIASSVGIPKDFFNIMNGAGGSRATALVGAEPFTKVIEEIQADFERLLLQITEEVMKQAGVSYVQGDIEFIFPSVTKDTTTETLKNIQLGEQSGYWSKETAGSMAAAEMNITGYDYEKEKDKGDAEREEGLALVDNVIPGQPGLSRPEPAQQKMDASPIAGQGKNNLKKTLNRI